MKHCSILLAAMIAFCGALLPVHARPLYVSPASSSPAPPYGTWTTAAHTIQEAVDAAAAGDTVVVGDGVYATGGRPEPIGIVLRNRVVINKAIRMQSLNGPSVTIIQGAAAPATRCVWLGGGATLHGFTLTGGVAQGGRGGGAWCATGAVLENCIIRDNWSSGDGGGVFQGTIRFSTLADNVAESSNNADGDGGGADHCILHNCLLTGNRGRKGGGADNSTLFNCVLSDNTARRYGGGATRSKLYNCTLTDNSARFGGGTGELCELYNCIAWHNEAPVGANYYEAVIHFSCTTPLPAAGKGNIAADPRLSSWSRISADSPCIGTGAAIHASGSDIDGQPWASPPAMGADQFHTTGPAGIPAVAIETDYTRLAVGFVARFKADITGPVINNRWSFGDGTVVHNQLEVMHTWSAPGVYEVALTAFKDAASPGVTATLMVQVVERPVAYVNKANANPVPPFATMATAAVKIQDAIGVSDVAGRLVLVAAGTYDTGSVAVEGTMLNRVALLHGVEVRSLSGPEVTIIRGAPTPAPGGPFGDGAVRCAYVSHGSVLDGFILTNGYTRATGHTSRDQGGGGAWCQRRGTVNRCTFSGNHAFRDGGGANGGNFYFCAFTGNSARDNGSAVDDAVLHHCPLTGHAMAGAASESRLYSCAITGNTTTYSAAAYGCSLQNCLLTGNSATSFGDASAVSECVVIHCTLTNNSSLSGPVGSSCSFANCIFYYNTPLAFDSGGSSYNHCCSPQLQPGPLLPGPGNISGEPRFVDRASGNFRLRPDSPCLDAGTALKIPVGVDFDGKPRPIDGNRDGILAPDMGTFEYGVVLELKPVGSQGLLSWVSAPGEDYLVEQSPNLTQWLPLPGGSASPVTIDWSPPARFFRLKPAP